jgi:hypothetical protein
MRRNSSFSAGVRGGVSLPLPSTHGSSHLTKDKETPCPALYGYIERVLFDSSHMSKSLHACMYFFFKELKAFGLAGCNIIYI